ncbi:MAG: hypothetical protein HeimC2_21160 [Candidatus Heimdallarchaeota archaeon LC_2]|nr:MAG: hypothetical protein HeimC2_21160 [Candidatus Heimdallarchaeota archaeon LC_2]
MSKARNIDRSDPNAIFDTIKEWMLEDDLFVKEVESADAIRFMVTRLGDNIEGAIMIPTDRKNRIVIAHYLAIPDDHYKSIQNLSNNDFANFWYELYTSLIKLGVDFQAFKQKKKFTGIALNYEVAPEAIFVPQVSVSKTNFYEKMSILRKAVLFSIHCVEYHTGNYIKFLGLDE